MDRRSFVALLIPAVAAAGCSKQRRSGKAAGSKAPKGPQGFGGMMAKEWAKDLTATSPEKRVRACKELANMGPAASSAVPALQRAAKDKNPAVSSAARDAIAAIRKK